MDVWLNPVLIMIVTVRVNTAMMTRITCAVTELASTRVNYVTVLPTVLRVRTKSAAVSLKFRVYNVFVFVAYFFIAHM